MDAPSNMRGAGLKFAEQQMQRHGWTEGKGLGKREDGISEAIKVKVKCDTAGVGHNSAEQFTFHWWDHVFNKTASSIAVEADEDGVKVKKVSGDDGAVTSKKPRKAMLSANMLYGRFIKSATLMSGGEKPLAESPSSSSSSEGSEDEDAKLDLSSATKLSDEDLVKICGGRTAHKGARHGLTMSAKLSRIEEQEKAFMEKYGKKEYKPEPSKSGEEKRKKRREGKVDDGEGDTLSGIIKKKKKKQRQETFKVSVEENLNGHDHVSCLQEDIRTPQNRVELAEEAECKSDHKNDHPRSKKKKKKKKSKKKAESEKSMANGHTENGEKEDKEHKNTKEEARKSKKKKHKEEQEVAMAEDEPVRKSKKKCKVDQEIGEHDPSLGENGRSRQEKKKSVGNQDEEEEYTSAKKKKKSKRKI